MEEARTVLEAWQVAAAEKLTPLGSNAVAPSLMSRHWPDWVMFKTLVPPPLVLQVASLDTKTWLPEMAQEVPPGLHAQSQVTLPLAFW